MKNSETIRRLIEQGVAGLGITLTAAQVSLLRDYLGELQRWNRVHNLTAVCDGQAMVSRHLLDSLAISPFVTGQTLLDVGSGAGLPGIPIAIARPDLQVTLLDANGKKVAFQRHAVRTLRLSNVQPLQARAEDYHPQALFSTVVARALARVTELLAMAGHLCRPGGRFLAMKGRNPAAEVANLPLGFDMHAVERVQVPDSDAQRHLVILIRNKLARKKRDL